MLKVMQFCLSQVLEHDRPVKAVPVSLYRPIMLVILLELEQIGNQIFVGIALDELLEGFHLRYAWDLVLLLEEVQEIIDSGHC